MSHFLCNILPQEKRKNNAEIQENRLGLSWILYTIYLFHHCQRIQNHLLRLLIFAFPLHCKPMITVKKSFCVNLLLILCAFTEIFLCSRFIPYSFPSCFFRYRSCPPQEITSSSLSESSKRALKEIPFVLSRISTSFVCICSSSPLISSSSPCSILL